MKHGADPNTVDGFYGHSLNRALLAGKLDIANLLITNGAKPEVSTTTSKTPPMPAWP